MVPARIPVLLISLCTWGCLVMYISSSLSLAAAASAHTRGQICTQDTCTFVFSLKEITAGRRHPASSFGVCHSQRWVAVFIGELHNVRAGTETHCCAPEPALARLDHCRARRVAPKTRVPRERRRSTVSHFDPMSGSIKSQLLKEARRQGKSDDRKGDPNATRLRGLQQSLGARQYSAHA